MLETQMNVHFILEFTKGKIYNILTQFKIFDIYYTKYKPILMDKTLLYSSIFVYEVFLYMSTNYCDGFYIMIC